MKMYDIIMKKRNGFKNTNEEINYVIKNYTEGKIPDYQISAWLMAIFFKEMSDEESSRLTMEMANSGDVMDLSPVKGAKIDKHSSGGVGDKTTLILGPMVASCGVKVAKMSGRGLGHTGGTLDKLEAIPGFKINVSTSEFFNIVNNCGLAVVGQTGNLAPADKKLYALRDVTATVDSIPLIAASIMSKKLAAGNDGIVLDVKCGKGAFMKDFESAKKLATIMVNIGKNNKRKMAALISDMNQPLGRTVGNSLEVKEAIETLKGNGPEDLNKLCINLGIEMLSLAQIGKNNSERKEMLVNNLNNNKACQKFKEMIKAQGGNPDVCDNPAILGEAQNREILKAEEDGYIVKIDALKVGECAMLTGAGRETKEDSIDLNAGIVLNKKVGHKVKKGETLASIHINKNDKIEKIKSQLLKAYKIEKTNNFKKKDLIYEVVR
ncbi:MAG: pyrimidine-nucleoside phosphorylase [Candidatus Muiribacteriota bacterium]